MGNKTFGATGTNTVVLFLEKYNEPPKKADLIEDSIDAVFNGCNLDGWEDKAILEQYLKKIDVSSEVYERFLSEDRQRSTLGSFVYGDVLCCGFDFSASDEIIKNERKAETKDVR